MNEVPEEDSHNKNNASNQLRTNLIKTKKNSLPHDREYLYAENLELKNKIKELTDLNTKIKTQLSATEKEKINLCNIAEEEAFRVKLPQRSQSGNHKKTTTNIPAYNITTQGPPMTLQKEKQNTAFKKLIREQTIEIEKLNNQIQRLKKTMKNTRMNELQTENQELLEETLRLKGVITDKKETEKIMFVEYAQEIQSLRDKLKKEKDSQKKNGFELKKQLDVNRDLKQKIYELQSKKINAQKRVLNENASLKKQLSEIKSKLYEQAVDLKKECERGDCAKALKEKNQLKKKNQSHLRQINKLKEEINFLKRQSLQKDLELRKTEQEKSFSKTPDKKQKSLNASTIKKVEPQRNVINQQSRPKIQQKRDQPQSKQKATQPLIEPKKGDHSLKNQEPQIEHLIIEPQMKSEENLQEKSKDKSEAQKLKDNLFKEVKDPRINKTKKTEKSLQEDSMNTEKLLQSFEGDAHNELILQSATKEKEKEKTEKEVQKQKTQQLDPKLIQSDGQYQALDFEQFEKEGPKAKDQDGTNGNDKKKKKKEKQKQKSKKKLGDDDEKLYSEQKMKQGDRIEKEELKLIKETLIYKLMASNYSYENFTSDLKSNKSIKELTSEQIFQLIGAEPFWLEQEQAETVLLYLFGTDQLTGNEVLSVKDFMKKMKKFIGTAINYNEAELSQSIQALAVIIEKGAGKLKSKFKEYDQGDGTVNLQDFSKVMASVKVKDDVLKMAIAQIAYRSRDLNHLDYEVFLKRFLEEGK